MRSVPSFDEALIVAVGIASIGFVMARSSDDGAVAIGNLNTANGTGATGW